MNSKRILAIVVSVSTAALPATSFAQNLNITRSILPDQPYTLIYPEVMVASGPPGGPITINHPNAPLQCDLTIVPAEDPNWSAETAVSSIDRDAVTAAWAETFPGFALGETGTKTYQDATALYYEGTSESSSMDVPVTLVHSETVRENRGYALDCIYATSVAEQVRPAVEFMIANFSTRSDADCCVGATPETEQAPPQ